MSARWASTFRLAYRLVRRSKGRATLIALLVAIPVLAGAFAAVTIRTEHLSPGEAAARELGHADAIAVVTGGKPLRGDYSVGRGTSGETISDVPFGGAVRPRADTDWAGRLPAGSRITPDEWMRNTTISAGDRAAEVQGVVLDVADPMTSGIYRVRLGKAPTGAGETALTTKLAERLHVGVGADVDLDGHAARVTAVVEDPNGLDAEEVIAPAATYGGLPASSASDWFSNVGFWLIDTPAGAPDLHDALLSDGVVYETRDQWMHPGPALASSSQVDVQVVLVLGTVAGFGLLEILLLAGAAFAVGTRRQTHELGLLAATGGDDRDVRRSVLAQGAVLGVVGAAVGVVGGVLTVFFLRSQLEMFMNRRFGALDVGVSDLVAVVVLGIVAGVLAAVVPARAAAARPVLQLLRERFDADGARARLPRWALVAIVGGATMTIVAAWQWHTQTGGLRSTYIETRSVSALTHGLRTFLHDNRWPAVLWLGSVLTVVGMVRACPALVARLAGLSGRLPVSARLALRDAGRHRHRTAPAVAAVMTVVAGAVLVLFVASSTDLRDKRDYQPPVPVGLIYVQSGGEGPVAGVAARTTELVGGGVDVLVSDALQPGHGQTRLVSVPDPRCDGTGQSFDTASCQFQGVGVVTSQAMDLITGSSVAARSALEAGSAVVLDAGLAPGGRVDVRLGNPGAPRTSRNADELRAVAVTVPYAYGGLPHVFVSPETAKTHGWRAHPTSALIKPDHLPSVDLMDRTQRTLGQSAYVSLAHDYESRYSVVLLAMLGAAAIATLAGTSIAVALAMAESRADMATLAAVGASPVRRRVHAMGQAATVASLGTGLGVALGALIALSTLAGSSLYPTSTPYRWLAAVLVVAPALAIAVAGTFTRSRVELTRRIA